MPLEHPLLTNKNQDTANEEGVIDTPWTVVKIWMKHLYHSTAQTLVTNLQPKLPWCLLPRCLSKRFGMSFQAPFSTILRISKFQKCAKYDPNKSNEIANETPHKPLHICTASCNAGGLKLYWMGPCTVHASNPSWFKLVYLRKLIYAIESLNLCIYIYINK